jgi:hypothetical protein
MIDHEKARSDTLRTELKQINVRLEMIDAAVKWWREALSQPHDMEAETADAKGGIFSHLPHPLMVYARDLMNKQKPAIDTSKADRVMAVLKDLLLDDKYTDDEGRVTRIKVDYEPKGVLADAVLLAEIDEKELSFPFKTNMNMHWREGLIEVAGGRGVPYVTIYGGDNA